MYKLDLPIDYKEAAVIERRRNLEEERKSRIFNAKTRLIGVDVQALTQQVNDRKQWEEREKRRNEAFAADAIRADRIAELLQCRQEHDIRQLNIALNEFRTLHQQPSNRREWDLNDPDSLKKACPARVNDNDPRCGISSMQRFDGEDLNSKARAKYQAEQRRQWVEQQIHERQLADENQKKADHLYELKMRELDQRACELQIAEEACRKAVLQATKDFNLAQARELAARHAVEKQQEDDDRKTEMANMLYGDLLTENPAVAQSSFGPHRVVPDRWKGMTPEQTAEIRRVQELQRTEAQRLREDERRRNEEFARQQLAHDRAVELLEREYQRNRRQLNTQMADENKRLSAEQKAHQEYLNKDVYTNKPTAAYFMQWNTSSR